MTRLLVCGLGHRGLNGFVRPLVGRGDATTELVGVIDVQPERQLALYGQLGLDVPFGGPEEFERLVESTDPDVIVVTTPDAMHEPYILAGLDLGRRVLTEKPMVANCGQARRVLEAERRTSGELLVSFNLRWDPVHGRIRELLASGAVGRITSVEMTYNVDTFHGPSYFLRWNRLRAMSGGLSVTKGCHHFDLVSWLIGQRPVEVFAYGALNFFGPRALLDRGGNCPFERLWRSAIREDYGYAAGMPADEGPGATLYDAEITIEDTYSAVVQFDGGASLAYSTNFSAPWEGYLLAVNGTEGRLESTYYAAPNRCDFPVDRDRTIGVLRLFGSSHEETVTLPADGHEPADRALRASLFAEEPGFDDERWGTPWEGALALAVGEGVWRAVVEHRVVSVADLLGPTEEGAGSAAGAVVTG